ncbi:MAG: VIT1/CCC1 transporter family protein [Minisyncoccia bacterium]
MSASTLKSKFAYYIGSLVYGANDGIITTFAVVAGAAGAGFSSSIIIVLGVANLVADGFSMGASKYLSMRSEQEVVTGHDVMHSRSAMHESFATFFAFIIAGSLPLLPFFFPSAAEHAFIVSSAATGVALFLVGSARALVIRKHAILAGLEMFLVGGAAASLAYIFGLWVETLIR